MPRSLLVHSIHSSPLALRRRADVVGSRLHTDTTLLRVRAGVYVDRAGWRKLSPWDRYLVRVHAFARQHPDAVLSHESAAALLGLPVFGEPRDIHVHDSGRARSRRFGDVCVHTSADDREVECRDGICVTSPAHTAVDLMRALPPAYSLAVGDAVTSAVRGGSASVTELEAIASAQRTGRGSAQLGFLLPMIDSRAESVGESVSRAVIVWSGFEPPELQLELISEGHRDRVDFAWRAARVLGESDGYEKYRTETSEEAVQRIIDEKRREDRLRRQCRSFGRWDWTTTVRVTPLVQRLDAMTVPRIGPPRDALLATLASNARSLPRARNHS